MSPSFTPLVVNVPDKATITEVIAGLMQYIRDKVATVEHSRDREYSGTSLEL